MAKSRKSDVRNQRPQRAARRSTAKSTSAKKTTSRAKSNRNKSIASSTETLLPSYSGISGSSRRFGFLPPINRTTLIIVVVVVAIIVIGVLNKSWIVAATVNGSPIFAPEVLGRINNQFRQQTLTQMINEKLILDEARKKGVNVSSDDVDARIAEIESEVGSAEQLDALLSAQNQSREDLTMQLRLQLTIEKLYENESAVSTDEIDLFIASNSATLVATDTAKQREEAEAAIKREKLNNIFNESFAKLREEANIQIY